MNTVAMPADIMSFIAAQSGGEAFSADGIPQESGAFGKMLGALMNGNAAVNAKVDVSESVSDAEYVQTENLQAADINGGEAKPLLDVISEKGLKAFAETVCRFLEGNYSPEATEQIWQNVPDREKEAFAELLKAVFPTDTESGEHTNVYEAELADTPVPTDTAQEKTPEEDILPDVKNLDIIQYVYISAEEEPVSAENIPSVKDIVRTLLKAVRNTLNKTKDRREEGKSDNSAVYDAIAAFGGVNPIADRSVLRADIPTEAKNTDETADGIISAQVSVRFELSGDKAEAPASAEAKLPEVELESIIQNVYNALETADDTELKDFCRELSQALESRLPDEAKAAENAKPAHTDLPRTDMPSSERHAVNVFSGARQAVMSRARNVFAEETPVISQLSGLTDVKAVLPQAETEISLPEDFDISQQIIEKIDLYENIAELTPGGEREITLSLSPEELGDLEIKIKRTNDGITVAFAAENSEAARLIGEKASMLADAVASRGMRIKEMSVTQQIVTEESRNNGMSYSGMSSGERSYSDSSSRNEPQSYGRTFTFDADGNAVLTEADGSESGKEIYYNKEARLWLSA
ncbi:MAG: flagellar hook-length control protein FliK [Ruminococcus sp.]|nr:flagellar hook-length control protein FliK [Ruminococcus sp.]